MCKTSVQIIKANPLARYHSKMGCLNYPQIVAVPAVPVAGIVVVAVVVVVRTVFAVVAAVVVGLGVVVLVAGWLVGPALQVGYPAYSYRATLF